MSAADDQALARRAQHRFVLAIALLLGLPALLTLLAFGALVRTPVDEMALGTPLVVTPSRPTRCGSSWRSCHRRAVQRRFLRCRT